MQVQEPPTRRRRKSHVNEKEQEQDEILATNIEFVKFYLKNEDISLKELADLSLAIEYILEIALARGYGADDKLSDLEESIKANE
jgi:hypothetical protein